MGLRHVHTKRINGALAVGTTWLCRCYFVAHKNLKIPKHPISQAFVVGKQCLHTLPGGERTATDVIAFIIYCVLLMFANIALHPGRKKARMILSFSYRYQYQTCCIYKMPVCSRRFIASRKQLVIPFVVGDLSPHANNYFRVIWTIILRAIKYFGGFQFKLWPSVALH